MQIKSATLWASLLLCATDSALLADNSPFATTLPATKITGTNVQLNGAVTPNGLLTVAWFQWGINASYGNQTTPTNLGGSGAVSFTSATIAGLTPSQVYHFRLVASNSAGVVFGADQMAGTAKRVWAWGYNGTGQTSVPVGASNSVVLAGGVAHTLGLSVGGIVTAWGYNYYGQIYVPTNLSNVVAIAAGYDDSMALRSNGTVAVWGDNSFSQTNVPAAATNTVAIAAGDDHCLALQSNGIVVAWGSDDDGESAVPVGLSNVVAIAAGGSTSMALLDNGIVRVWGNNSYGQRSVPLTASNIVGITCGLFHCVALRSDGTVVVWGDAEFGQTAVPASATNVLSVAAGRLHTLALTSTGRVVSWGNNDYAQTTVPPSLTNAIAITAGGAGSYALSSGKLPISTSTVIQANTVNFNGFIVPISSTDPDGFPLTNVIMSLPAGGLLDQEGNIGQTLVQTPGTALNPGWSLFYSPTNNIGQRPAPFITSIQYRAVYGPYASDPATVTVVVSGPPSVTNQSAIILKGTNVLFTGNAAANYSPTGGWFEWGTTQSYGNATAVFALGTNTNLVQFTGMATGLAPLTTYHYRAVVSNAVLVAYGTDSTFQTALTPFSAGAMSILPSKTARISFSATPNTTYHLWASTNLMNWSLIGTSTEIFPGQYQADDVHATNFPRRFYQLRWP